MKTVLILLTALAISADVIAQSLSGIIQNQSGEPIPYASLCWNNGLQGAHTDSAGRYSISLANTLTPVDTIYVSSIGYKTLRIKYKEITALKIISLERAHYDLPVVTIKPVKSVETDFGFAQLPTSMLKLSGNPGSMVLTSIANTTGKPLLIKNVIMRLDGAGKKGALKLRIHILPYGSAVSNSIDLLPEPVVVQCRRRKEVVDLSKYKVTFPEQGVTVAIEWIGNTNEVIQKDAIIYPAIRCTGKAQKIQTAVFSVSKDKQDLLIVPDEVPSWMLNRTQNACISVTAY